jgi:hypothetical protein
MEEVRIAALVVGHAPLVAGLLERPVLLIDEQEIAHRVVGHEHVHIPVAVEIRDGDAHPLAQFLAEAGRVGDIFEAAVAEVVIQAVRDIGIDLRMAIVFLAVCGADFVGLRGPDGVVGDDQIQLAVVVVVEPGGGDAQNILRLGDAGALGDVGESAVAVVVVKRTLRPALQTNRSSKPSLS